MEKDLFGRRVRLLFRLDATLDMAEKGGVVLACECLGGVLFHTKREGSRVCRDACCSATGLRPTVAAQSGHNLWLLFHAHKYRMLAEEQVASIWAGKTT